MTNERAIKILERLVNNPETYGTFAESGVALSHAITALKEQEKTEVELACRTAQAEDLKRDVAELQAENEKLKQGICEHVEKDELASDCILCELAVSEDGYPKWVEKTKKLQAENDKLRNEIKGIEGVHKVNKHLNAELQRVKNLTIIDYKNCIRQKEFERYQDGNCSKGYLCEQIGSAVHDLINKGAGSE